MFINVFFLGWRVGATLASSYGDQKIASQKIGPQQIPSWIRVRVGGNLPVENFPSTPSYMRIIIFYYQFI